MRSMKSNVTLHRPEAKRRMEDCWESESISKLAGVQTKNSTALKNAALVWVCRLQVQMQYNPRSPEYRLYGFEVLSDSKILHSSFFDTGFYNSENSLLKKFVRCCLDSRTSEVGEWQEWTEDLDGEGMTVSEMTGNVRD